MRILITGGVGFIGSHLIKELMLNPAHHIANVDALTYAANLARLQGYEDNARYRFFATNIANFAEVNTIFADFSPQAVIHLASESHVDRSIKNAAPFIHTNIVGTYSLLENIRFYWKKLSAHEQADFRLLHVSSDEVFGSLQGDSPLIAENASYEPNSPYSASKASSDCLVRAWHKTYGIPCIITHCSNNYGEFQHDEKLIPRMISCALAGRNLPIYGDGSQIRDWIHVRDHVAALLAVLERGTVGETYNISAHQELSNLELVKLICTILDELNPIKSFPNQSYQELISFVKDRKGHDQRYALNACKIQSQLNWKPQIDFEEGLWQTVSWYVKHQNWWHKNASN